MSDLEILSEHIDRYQVSPPFRFNPNECLYAVADMFIKNNDIKIACNTSDQHRDKNEKPLEGNCKTYPYDLTLGNIQQKYTSCMRSKSSQTFFSFSCQYSARLLHLQLASHQLNQYRSTLLMLASIDKSFFKQFHSSLTASIYNIYTNAMLLIGVSEIE